MRSSSWPERPTKGRPSRSSSRPGASPTSMMSASGLPSAKTRFLAVKRRLQPSNSARQARSSSSDEAVAARLPWQAPPALRRERHRDRAALREPVPGGATAGPLRPDAAPARAGVLRRRLPGCVPVPSGEPVGRLFHERVVRARLRDRRRAAREARACPGSKS